MNGTDIFVDTNICIYLLDGDMVLSEMLQGQSLYISIITEMELYAYHSNNAASLQVLDTFLQSISVMIVLSRHLQWHITYRLLPLTKDLKK